MIALPLWADIAVSLLVLAGAAVLGLFTFEASNRQALIVSLTAMLMSLSIVVITGC